LSCLLRAAAFLKDLPVDDAKDMHMRPAGEIDREAAVTALTRLQACAGPGARLVSFSLELANLEESGAAEPEVIVRKQTRSLAFVSLTALRSGEMQYAAKGLFVLS
jgi:hypothetical protein